MKVGNWMPRLAWRRAYGFHHKQPHLFTTSQWQQTGAWRHRVTLPYLIFRLKNIKHLIAI